MNKEDINSFWTAIKKLNDYKEKNFGVTKLREYLGREPWSEENVLYLFMKNPDAMNEILRSHEGYQMYSKITGYNLLLKKEYGFYTEIIKTIESCKKDIQHIRPDNAKNSCSKDFFKILFTHQELVNLYFFGYISVCAATKDIETNLMKNLPQIKNYASQQYDVILNKYGIHNAIMLLRNRICHGKNITFKYDFKKYFVSGIEEISFKINSKDSLSIIQKDKKDRIGLEYLNKISFDLLTLVKEYHTNFLQFHKNIIQKIFNEKVEKIHLANEYYKKIYIQMEIQARAAFSPIIKNPAPLKIHDSDTYYLDYDMGLVNPDCPEEYEGICLNY